MQTGRRRAIPRASDRLKYLWHNHYLYRESQPTRDDEPPKPYLYWLDRKGAQLLAELDGVPFESLDWNYKDRKVGRFAIQHLIDSNTFRVSVEVAARDQGFTLHRWLDEFQLVGMFGQKAPRFLLPDAYFHVSTPYSQSHFFVEIDRGTESGRRIGEKIKSYIEKLDTSFYTDHFGVDRFRVLLVALGPKRVANLREICLRQGGKARFWLAVLSELTSQSVLTDPVWLRADASRPTTLLRLEPR